MVAQAVINASRMNGRHAAMEGKTFPTTTQLCVALPVSFVQEPDLHGRIFWPMVSRGLEIGSNDDLSHAKLAT